MLSTYSYMSRRYILLHGALGNGAQMQPLSQLIDAQAPCPDFYGHGARSEDERPFSVEGFASDLAWPPAEKVHLIGYSMGGYVALYIAATWPEKVSSVVALATKFAWTPEGALKEAAMLDPAKVKEKVPGFAFLLESRHGAMWPQVMERTSAFMLGLGERPLLTDRTLAAIQCPVLLLRGELDAMVSEDETLQAARHIVRVSYLELPGQPHQLEKMDLGSVVLAIKDRGFY